MSLLSDLSKAGIIDEQDVAELNIKLKKNRSKSGEPLRTLYFFFESKVLTRPDTGGFFLVIDSLANYKNENDQDTFAYKKLLQILFDNGVIPEIVFQKINAFPLKSDKSGHFVTFYLASELTAFYQHFTTDMQLEFAKLLNGKDPYGRDSMVDQRKKNKLTKDIKAGKLETYLDFFKYCYHCDFIDLAKYQEQPQKLIEKLTKILNPLCYGTFTISGIEIHEEDFIGEPSYNNKQNTIVLHTGDRKHQHVYTFSVGEGRTSHKPALILENLLSFINKLLADYTCSYRFTGVTNTLNKDLFPTSRERYAICRVNQENLNAFEFYDMQLRFLYNRPTPLFHRFPLSYTHIAYAIYHFRHCGLLVHLSDGQLNQVMENLYQNTYETIGDLIVVFPDTLAIANRTVTSGKKPYSDFLLALNHISRGILSFTDIYDGTPDQIEYETDQAVKISFTCNNKHHEVECNVSYKEFDTGIIYYVINEIIRKEYTDYQLIQLISSNYQQDCFLFATNQQSQYLDKMKLRMAIDRF